MPYLIMRRCCGTSWWWLRSLSSSTVGSGLCRALRQTPIGHTPALRCPRFASCALLLLVVADLLLHHNDKINNSNSCCNTSNITQSTLQQHLAAKYCSVHFKSTPNQVISSSPPARQRAAICKAESPKGDARLMVIGRP